MEINVQSVKFDADAKLLEFIEKKLSRIEKFNAGINALDVTLTLLPDNANKCVKIRAHAAGKDLFVEKNANTFEDAVTICADVLKEQISRLKDRD